MFLSLLRAEESLAATVLLARGLKAAVVREELAKELKASGPVVRTNARRQPDDKPNLRLDSFLTGLKWKNADELMEFFAESACLIDVFGKRWSREETLKSFATLFAPYAKKNAAPVVEEIVADSGDLFVAGVLWKNAILASLDRVWIHRMSVVMIRENGDWRILLIHVTPVQTAAGASAS